MTWVGYRIKRPQADSGIPEFVWAEENLESELPVSRLRFEMNTSQILVTCGGNKVGQG